MKTRITKHVVVLCLLLFTAGVGLNGCDEGPVSPDVGGANFSSIRVMNFAECSPPYDLFIYKEESKDTIIFRALAYGVGGAYATNLPLGKYHVVLKYVNRDASLDHKIVEFTSSSQQTFIIWNDSGAILKQENPDREVANPDPTKVYVRFLNTKTSFGQTRLTLDNPLNNPPSPVFEDVNPRKLTEYVPLKHVFDGSYTFYLTRTTIGKEGVADGAHQVISRLAGATFAPGNFYTVVFGGNEGDCRDTSAAKADTLRIRYFDDNQAGNDLSFPVPQSLRFNFVNNLINPPVQRDGQRRYDEIGVVINNEDRYLIPRMKAGEVSPLLNDVAESDPNVISTGFYTMSWTDAVLISMYKVDGLTGQQRGTKLVNVIGETMPGERIKSDEPFSIVVMDTVVDRMSNGIPAIDIVSTLLVPLPDVTHADSVTLVLVNGLARFKIQPVSAGTQSTFAINGITPSFWSTPQTNRKFSRYTIHKDALINGKIDVRVDIGRTVPVHTLTKSFKAEPGGVYEVVLVGQRENTSEQGKPQILVLHTNPKRLDQ